ncbi:hypothetical protein PoB_005606000 [Plakobranchus ocellatus]|uniref:Uncharacterized protein n=1 Tax=Plakobranchus ocellatus TaxID=259542 RepID=A0AAV4CD27_9GAST|nr:hypothetical protein PoB_005606000 [Plakobranchus ocellatus]
MPIQRSGRRNQELREKGLTTALDLTNLLKHARTLEMTEEYCKQLPQYPQQVNKIHHRSTLRPALTKHRQGAQQNYHHSKQVTPPAQKCRNCGGSRPHVGGQNKCPAFNKTFCNCSKLHHFASVCKSAPAKPSRFSSKRKTIRNIQESSELDHDAESTDEDC